MVGTPSKMNKYCHPCRPLCPSRNDVPYAIGPDTIPETDDIHSNRAKRKPNSPGRYILDIMYSIPGMKPLSAALNTNKVS